MLSLCLASLKRLMRRKSKLVNLLSIQIISDATIPPHSPKASILVLMELGMEKDDVVAELVSQQ